MEHDSTSGFSKNFTITSKENINELRKLLIKNQIITRENDWFLDRFLQLAKGNVEYAIQKLIKYENFRKINKDWLIISKLNMRYVLETKCLVLLDGCDKVGRKILWVRLGKWEPDNCTCDNIMQVAALIAEIHLITYKFKPLAVTIMFDLNEFGLKQLNAISTKFAKKMVQFLSECAPIDISSIYVLRESKLFSLIYSCFKPFLNEKMKKCIQLFGQDLIALREYIPVENLPIELGGTSNDVITDKWLDIIKMDGIKKELINAGYEFYDEL